ncbi:MAG: hypothetical protein H6945_13250 [Zoogloeaceae bacterium]|nr:hypothetical protein [Rhodocyclaceae bacterium]MCP5236693.1 hypothetical protein [Zoogloeaceae bacterium]
MHSEHARQRLIRENLQFAGSGGVSQENANQGFRPAFRDCETLAIYPSRFADGRAAPFHLVDGLPAEAIEARDARGRVLRIKDSVVSGFVRNGRFYTREEASRALATLH